MKTILTDYFTVILAGLLVTTGQSFGELGATADLAAITSTIEAFHKALAAGKPEQVMSLLQPDALIIEGGVVQTRSEYGSEHLAEDIAFARAVPATSQNVAVRQEGNAAWVTTLFRVVGEFHGKPVNSRTAETAILTRTPTGWRIRAIHWSRQRGEG